MWSTTGWTDRRFIPSSFMYFYACSWTRWDAGKRVSLEAGRLGGLEASATDVGCQPHRWLGGLRKIMKSPDLGQDRLVKPGMTDREHEVSCEMPGVRDPKRIRRLRFFADIGHLKALDLYAFKHPSLPAFQRHSVPASQPSRNSTPATRTCCRRRGWCKGYREWKSRRIRSPSPPKGHSPPPEAAGLR